MTLSISGQRILIGARCFADADAAFRLVERFESLETAELGGVLIDDQALTELARWSTQRIVTSGGALIELPTARQMQKFAEHDARAFREKLSALARANSLRWSFRQDHGDLIQRVFESAGDWDILLLGQRTVHKRSGRIVDLSAGSSSSRRAERLARDLADVLHLDRLTLSLSPTVANEPQQGAAFICDQDETSLLVRLGRTNASALIIDLEASPFRTMDQLRQVLEAARCPVVVLGPKRIEGLPEQPAEHHETQDHRGKKQASD